MQRSQLKLALTSLQQVMQQQNMWQVEALPDKAMFSQLPFCVDTLFVEQWLQFIFLPKMAALLVADSPLPSALSIGPYVEQDFQRRGVYSLELLSAIRVIDGLFGVDKC